MKQLTQKRKDGEMELLEIPAPSPTGGRLVVRTGYSVISVGTEGRSVRDARAGYLQKAMARPKQVKKVIKSAKERGLLATYRMVRNELSIPAPLGYSLSGTVVDLGEGVRGFSVGDRVASGGQGAVHAESVSVLPNLTVRVPKNVDLKDAAFTTIGSIAIQGVRQADIEIGETCAVIGLGLVGQLTVQILRAAGVKTVGIDLESSKVALARENGIDLAFEREAPGLEEQVETLTSGYGVDAVIITAATDSNDPVNLAGRLARRKGVVVSVGRVSTDFDRDPYYYKELDLRMSCSYGPGRYDRRYEEKGIDYPFEYVRWTENRNMQAFVDLLSRNAIRVAPLVTHNFPFEEAPAAYDLILNDDRPCVGVVLDYGTEDQDRGTKTELRQTQRELDAETPAATTRQARLNVGFIGAGSFAQRFLLPDVADQANLVAVATRHGRTAEHVRRKFGFSEAHTDGMSVLTDDRIDTVFIATRHNTHAHFVVAALERDKNVFVEKPLCLSEEELEQIEHEFSRRDVHLMVGYNRRFAPLVEELTDNFPVGSPKTIDYRVNTGPIDEDHWTLDPDIGGGRILGELCHFIDLAQYLVSSRPVGVAALGLQHPVYGGDTASTIIEFKDGSVASLDYFTNGSPHVDKERLEVHCDGTTAVLRDFRRLEVSGDKTLRSRSKLDKGHSREIKEFLEAVRRGSPTPIPFGDIYWTSRLSFDVLQAMEKRTLVRYVGE